MRIFLYLCALVAVLAAAVLPCRTAALPGHYETSCFDVATRGTNRLFSYSYNRAKTLAFTCSKREGKATGAIAVSITPPKLNAASVLWGEILPIPVTGGARNLPSWERYTLSIAEGAATTRIMTVVMKRNGRKTQTLRLRAKLPSKAASAVKKAKKYELAQSLRALRRYCAGAPLQLEQGGAQGNGGGGNINNGNNDGDDEDNDNDRRDQQEVKPRVPGYERYTDLWRLLQKTRRDFQTELSFYGQIGALNAVKVAWDAAPEPRPSNTLLKQAVKATVVALRMLAQRLRNARSGSDEDVAAIEQRVATISGVADSFDMGLGGGANNIARSTVYSRAPSEASWRPVSEGDREGSAGGSLAGSPQSGGGFFAQYAKNKMFENGFSPDSPVGARSFESGFEGKTNFDIPRTQRKNSFDSDFSD